MLCVENGAKHDYLFMILRFVAIIVILLRKDAETFSIFPTDHGVFEQLIEQIFNCNYPQIFCFVMHT